MQDINVQCSGWAVVVQKRPAFCIRESCCLGYARAGAGARAMQCNALDWSSAKDRSQTTIGEESEDAVRASCIEEVWVKLMHSLPSLRLALPCLACTKPKRFLLQSFLKPAERQLAAPKLIFFFGNV